MKNRISKTVSEKLSAEQLERRWRREQRAKGVTLVPLDTSKIRGRLLRETVDICTKKQIAVSQFLNQALEEYFIELGYLRSGKAVAA